MSLTEDVRTEALTRETLRSAWEERALPELIDALRWRWKPTLLIAALFTLGATVYVERLPPQYDGEAIVGIGFRPEVSGATSDTVRVLGPKYVEYVTAAETVRTVAAQIDEDPTLLGDTIQADIATDTGNLKIVVRLGSPERAAEAANAFAGNAIKFSQQDPLLNAQLVARALPPTKPAAPPRRLLEVASLIVGLLLGTLAAILLERGRPRVRAWRDIPKITGYPLVGRIPPSRVLRTRPLQAFADARTASAFRILRANLEPQLRGAEIDILVVTSPSPADGKTTTSALTAEAFARLGMRVILIDADLRRPGLAKLVKADPNPGLSTVLRKEVSFSAAIRDGWTENLWMLPTTHDTDAGDLLARRFGAVLEEAQEQFDLVIVDSPPLLGTEDARTLALAAKAILLVVSGGAATTSVNEAVLSLEALRAPLLGVIANRFHEVGSSYNYYY